MSSAGVTEQCLECSLPKGLNMLEVVEGGGDSLFKSVLLCRREQEEKIVELP
jgi:hypothetical protein